MNALNLIRTRRSIRGYADQPVLPDLIDQLLEAATWAPSSHNRQPWRFAVITTQDAKDQLADRMGERLWSDRARDGDPAEAIERDVNRSRERIISAPVIIVACLSPIDLDHYPDERRNSLERTMAVQSVGASIQNLLLAAHELGLGACWMCAPLFCPDVVRQVLHLPDDWEAQALITLGYPANVGKSRSRVDFREITVWR
ncbi:3-hydroxypropanoate dehydrogenase [Thermoflexales bacterium]|nr:3-hydroxypropanoate dehydrogenase [Thermoflexales bacterium]